MNRKEFLRLGKEKPEFGKTKGIHVGLTFTAVLVWNAPRRWCSYFRDAAGIFGGRLDSRLCLTWAKKEKQVQLNSQNCLN